MSGIHQMLMASHFSGPAIFDPAWLYRKEITIDSSLVAENLVRFPMLISLASDADLASNAQADADDIVFTDTDGLTIIPHELESYNSGTGALVAWVRVPDLSSTVDKVIYMYYGNSGASAQENPDGVWAGNYVSVHHLGESPGGSAPQFADSAPVPDCASSFGYTSRWTADATDATADAQGVATDGTSIWYSTSTILRKFQKDGTELVERNVTGDAPTDKLQINGLFYKDGVLYASAAKIVSDVGTSYIVEYDPDDLTYITHHTLSGDRFSEGLAWKDGYWWVIYHAQKLIGQFDASWTLVADHALKFQITGNSGLGTGGTYGQQGYDGMAWHGDFLYLNIHEIYNQDFVDVYHWNGSSFDAVYRHARPTANATQGLVVDPTESGVIWFVERNASGDSGVAKCTIVNAFARADGTVGSAPTQAAAKIGNGVDFDGSDDYIAAGTNARSGVRGHLTLSAWLRPDGAGTQYGGVVCRVTGNTAMGYAMLYNYANDGKITAWVSNGSFAFGIGTTVLSIGVFYRVSFVYDLSSAKVYVNGVHEAGLSQSFAEAIGVSANPISIGRYMSTSNWFTAGVIDEARIEHAARSANWLLTEYRNQNSPSTFYAVGAEEVR